MNQTSDILVPLNGIKAMLEQISTNNGYNHNPTVRQGWLRHIFPEHMRTPQTFPLLAYRPDLSVPDGRKTENTSMIDTVTLVIDGAVMVKDTDTPVDDLLNLIKDVRRSLVFDPDKNTLGISELVFQDCPFDIPEAGDDYAFFSQKISFRVVEQYA